MKVGDKVKVNDKLQIERDGEEKMIGQEAEVVEITSFVFPIKIRFLDSDIEKLNIELGVRMFDEFELDLL